MDVSPLVEPEFCDHRDDFGSTIWSQRMCILCGREVPLTVREALWYLWKTIAAKMRRN